MKVLFNNFNTQKITQNKICKTNRNISFCAQPTHTNIRFSNIKKISSEAEYDGVFERLKTAGVFSSWWKIGNKYEQGLMPYIGQNDISARINSFLRNGTVFDGRYSKTALENIVRIMDYALDSIDEIFGKYEGIVYRYGKVDKISKNFLSTARDPNGVTRVIPERERRCLKDPFYIIDIKNGHKVEEVQKKLRYNDVYTEESEILLNPAKFEEVTQPSAEMVEAKEKLEKTLDKNHIYCRSNFIFLKEV